MISREKAIKFLSMSFGFRRPEYKWQILLIILFHLIGWLLFFSMPLLFFNVAISDYQFLWRELLNKLFLIALFYANYFYFIPRLFEKRKLVKYALALLLSFLFLWLQQLFVEKYFIERMTSFERPIMQVLPLGSQGEVRIFRDSLPVASKPAFQIRRSEQGIISSAGPGMVRASLEDVFVLGVPKGLMFVILANTVSSGLLIVLMGAFIRLSFSLVRNQDEKKALENANLNAEVNFLKSQINPHFLFNTLNSIYSQAHSKSANTEFSILKLSDILRYVLYESGDEKIPLQKDLQYITNYIDLQRLRISDMVDINYTIEGSTDGLFISPLLLITYIENAFKYGVSYVNPGSINIGIKISDETLTLRVENPIHNGNTFEAGGIGLKNAKRRLDLLYPYQYLLDIREEESKYIVHLKIKLTNDQLHYT